MSHLDSGTHLSVYIEWKYCCSMLVSDFSYLKNTKCLSQVKYSILFNGLRFKRNILSIKFQSSSKFDCFNYLSYHSNKKYTYLHLTHLTDDCTQFFRNLLNSGKRLPVQISIPFEYHNHTVDRIIYGS